MSRTRRWCATPVPVGTWSATATSSVSVTTDDNTCGIDRSVRTTSKSVVEHGAPPLELEDVDVAPADVHMRDRLVFAVGSPSPSDGPEVFPRRGEHRDLGIAEVRDQDPAAAVHRHLGERGDDMEAGVLQPPIVAMVSSVITHSAQVTSPETVVGCWAERVRGRGASAGESPRARAAQTATCRRWGIERGSPAGE